jgi:hypothetical protein
MVTEAAKRLARSIWLRRLSASVMTAAIWFGSLSERSLTTLWLMICQYGSVAALAKNRAGTIPPIAAYNSGVNG